MTFQKTIDNIQTRLEDLISERFTGTYQNIDITCSTYNPTIDTSVTITITVTDQNGDPISGFTVPLKIDGTSISGITTNSSGVATHTYNCTEWGNHKISVKSVSAFIRVTGWKTAVSDGVYTVKYNENYVSVTLNYDTAALIDTTVRYFGAEVLKDGNIDLRPPMPVITGDGNQNFYIVANNNYAIGRYRLSGSKNIGCYAHFLYKRK